jgi:hypothetical protein
MRVLERFRTLAVAASIAAIVLTFANTASAQGSAPPLSSSDIAWRTDFLKRRGYFASYSVAGSRVTAVVGPKMRFIPSDDSRRELCAWVLSAHKVENTSLTSARLVDSQGQVLLECVS